MAIDHEKEIFEIKKQVAENNKILHSLQRKSRFTTAITLIKWVAIAFIAFGVYSFIQPVLATLTDSYNTIVEGAGQIKEIKESVPSFDLKNLFNRD